MRLFSFVVLMCLLLTPGFAKARQASLYHRPRKSAVYRITLTDGSKILGTRYRLKRGQYIELLDHKDIIIIPLRFIHRIEYRYPRKFRVRNERLEFALSKPNPKSRLQRRLYYKDYKGHFMASGISLFASLYAISLLASMSASGNAKHLGFYAIPLIGPVFAAGYSQNSPRDGDIIVASMAAAGQVIGMGLFLHGFFKKKTPYIPHPKKTSRLSRLSRLDKVPKSSLGKTFELMTTSVGGVETKGLRK